MKLSFLNYLKNCKLCISPFFSLLPRIYSIIQTPLFSNRIPAQKKPKITQTTLHREKLIDYSWWVVSAVFPGPAAAGGRREHAAEKGGQDLRSNGQEPRRQADPGGVSGGQQGRPEDRAGAVARRRVTAGLLEAGQIVVVRFKPNDRPVASVRSSKRIREKERERERKERKRDVGGQTRCTTARRTRIRRYSCDREKKRRRGGGGGEGGKIIESTRRDISPLVTLLSLPIAIHFSLSLYVSFSSRARRTTLFLSLFARIVWENCCDRSKKIGTVENLRVVAWWSSIL